MSDKPLYYTVISSSVEFISDGVGVVVSYSCPELIYLKRAFEQSLGYVGEATFRQVGGDFREIAESIVPALLLAGGVVVGTTALGAGIGALFGGVGAAPGAGVGFEVGMAIIDAVGLASLAIYIVAHISEATVYFERGFEMAWNSQGNPDIIRAAAKILAEGAGVLASLIVQALIAVIAKEGFAQACEKLGNTGLGGKLTRWMKNNRDLVESQAIITALKLEVGTQANAFVRKNVITAMRWFREKMPAVEAKGSAHISSYLEGIDFHKMVRRTQLPENMEVVAYRIPGKKMGNYYTVRGTGAERLGVDPVGRKLYRYRVTKSIDALESSASPMRYNKPKFDALRRQVDPSARAESAHSPMHSGGGKQYTISDSDLSALEVIEPFNPPGAIKAPVTETSGWKSTPGIVPDLSNPDNKHD